MISKIDRNNRLNWTRIINFSMLHFTTLTLVSALITLSVGVDNLDGTSISISVILQIPLVLTEFIILFVFARKQQSKTLWHLSLAVLASEFVSFVILSIIMSKLYVSSESLVALLISALTIIVAMFVANYFYSKSNNTQWY